MNRFSSAKTGVWKYTRKKFMAHSADVFLMKKFSLFIFPLSCEVFSYIKNKIFELAHGFKNILIIYVSRANILGEIKRCNVLFHG